MIVVRDVFQAKYGKGDELVALLKEVAQLMAEGGQGRSRVLTDLSGPFFTIVSEIEVESMAEWERGSREMFARPEFGEWFGRMVPLVESGRREFYTIES